MGHGSGDNRPQKSVRTPAPASDAPWSTSKAMRVGVCHGACFGMAIGLPRTLFLQDRDILEFLVKFLVGLIASYCVFGWFARRFRDSFVSNSVSIVSMLVLLVTLYVAGAGTEQTFDRSGPEIDADGAVMFVVLWLFFLLLFSLGNMLAGWIGMRAGRGRNPRA